METPNSAGSMSARIGLPTSKPGKMRSTSRTPGVGRTRGKKTLEATGISADLRVKDLGDAELVALRDHLENAYKLEGDLRREVAADIRRKVEIGSYEGIRHRRGLPVRGQRTKTNARTRKGPKRTVAGKKKAGR